MKGSYHFLQDVIFNESVPGHLSPICPATEAPILPLSPHTVHSQVRTAGGQAFADIIHAHDTALEARHSQHVTGSNAQSSGGDSPLSLLTILDFTSLAVFDLFHDSLPVFSLSSFIFSYLYFFRFYTFFFLVHTS